MESSPPDVRAATRDATRRGAASRRDIDVRRGTAEDAGGLVAMHRRCSAESVYRRYHVSTPHLSPRLARTIAEPPTGWSLLATFGDVIIGVAMVAPSGAGDAEVGILVEDAWQRRGIGARLLRASARQAAETGSTTLLCVIQSDNTAMLATIRRTGLTAHIATIDGRHEARMPIGHVVALPQRRRDKTPSMGNLTTPLVTLLHRRPDVRAIPAPAEPIDRAVRDSA